MRIPTSLVMAALLSAAPCGLARAQVQQMAERARQVAAQMALCPVKADQARLDAGFVSPNTTVQFKAVLRNTSDKVARCVRSAASCTCTVVDMLGKEIPPGGTMEVPLSLRTSGATGEKSAEVILAFEGMPGLIELSIRCEVTYPVRGVQLNPGPDGKQRRDPFVNAFEFPENLKGEITVEALDGKPFRVLSVDLRPPVFVDFDPVNQGPRESYRVRYDISPSPGRAVPKYMVIETDRPDARLIDMRVRHDSTRINPAFGFGQYRENLGVLAPGETRTFELEIKRANGVRIDSVLSMEPRLDSTLLAQKPGADDGMLVTVAVTAKPDAAEGVMLSVLRFVGVGPDPKRPVPPGQPAATSPRESDFIIYGKVEKPMPKLDAKPVKGAEVAVPVAVRDAVLAPPAAALDPRIDATKITALGDPAVPATVRRPLPVVQRIAAGAAQVPMDPARFARARDAVAKGLGYLRSTQGAGGLWMEGTAAKATDQAKASPAVSGAVTALVLKAFAQAGATAQGDATAKRGMRALADATVKAGRFDAATAGGLASYLASAALMAFAAQQDDAFAAETEAVRDWLVRAQWDQGEGVGPRDDWFGGVGYGNHGRPDLSNTQMMLDALHDAGTSTDDPAVQRALVFVQRTQNLKDGAAEWARNGTGDGGFVYTPANGGESFASETAGEGRHGEKMPPGTRALRSYGSMTYAGFKSMLFAGLAPEDARVKAAWDWVRRNYRFDENPGLGQQGRYYYLHAVARALFAAGQATLVPVVDGKDAGAPRNWRDDLCDALLSSQRADGSWVNAADRWQEGQPDLVTAYALLALEEAIKPVLAAE
jgi:squalene-hopene/tetraprenyl-beta-curcumene cyclase